MKVYAEYDELPIPGYALSYLVNGDDSGIDDEDKRAIDAYMEDYYKEAKEVSGSVIFSCSGEPYHSKYPEFGEPCEVEDCTITILVDGQDNDARCDQCEAMMINGIYCHETGCPNTHKVKIDGEWIEPESDNEDYDEYAEDYDD